MTDGAGRTAHQSAPPATVRRVGARRLFKPLDRRYWPRSVQFPYLRLLIGFVAAPGVTTLVAACLAWLVYAETEHDPDRVTALTIAAARETALGLYMLTTLSGVVALPYLWSTRRRSFWPWLFCGGVAGVIAGSIGVAMTEGPPTFVPQAVLGILGASTYLVWRAMAGVRSSLR